MSVIAHGDLIRVVHDPDPQSWEMMEGKICTVTAIFGNRLIVQRIISRSSVFPVGVSKALRQGQIIPLDLDTCTDEELADIAAWRLTQ